MRSASDFLDKGLDAANLFIPNLTGGAMLFLDSAFIDSVKERREVYGFDLLSMSVNLPLMSVCVEKLVYKSSEPISISVDTPADGYLCCQPLPAPYF